MLLGSYSIIEPIHQVEVPSSNSISIFFPKMPMSGSVISLWHTHLLFAGGGKFKTTPLSFIVPFSSPPVVLVLSFDGALPYFTRILTTRVVRKLPVA